MSEARSAKLRRRMKRDDLRSYRLVGIDIVSSFDQYYRMQLETYLYSLSLTCHFASHSIRSDHLRARKRAKAEAMADARRRVEEDNAKLNDGGIQLLALGGKEAVLGGNGDSKGAFDMGSIEDNDDDDDDDEESKPKALTEQELRSEQIKKKREEEKKKMREREDEIRSKQEEEEKSREEERKKLGMQAKEREKKPSKFMVSSKSRRDDLEYWYGEVVRIEMICS